MATYEITTGRMPPIDFAPATVEEEILQNIRCAFTTIKGSVPLDRDFGLDATYLDAPMEKAKAKMVSEIVMAVAKYEPRATVTDIDWEADIDGVLKAKVKVTINESE